MFKTGDLDHSFKPLYQDKKNTYLPQTSICIICTNKICSKKAMEHLQGAKRVEDNNSKLL